MRFRFKHKTLRDLYESGRGSRKYPPGVIDAFFEVMAMIEAAIDERDLRALKSLHFERLGGRPVANPRHSLRLNDQYRLIIAMEQDEQGRLCCIIELNKHYHR